jgi:hypothetical protein
MYVQEHYYLESDLIDAGPTIYTLAMPCLCIDLFRLKRVHDMLA